MVNIGLGIDSNRTEDRTEINNLAHRTSHTGQERGKGVTRRIRIVALPTATEKHERTVQRRVHGLGRARNVDGYIHHPGWQRLLWSQRPKGHLRCISRPLGEREVRHGGLRPTWASS